MPTLEEKQKEMRERNELRKDYKNNGVKVLTVADEYEERDFDKLVARRDLLCPFCHNHATKANRTTGEIQPCQKCVARRITLKRHNLTLHEYYYILNKQNNKCAICGRDFGNKMPFIDHCHELQHVRGLLCSNCNAGLGMFLEDCDFLKNAIKYLKLNILKRSWWKQLDSD